MALSRAHQVSIVGGLAVAGALVWFALHRPATHPQPDSALDPGAQLACGEFASLSDNLSALSDAELRDRLRVIYDDAKPWPSSAVAIASRDALDAMTRGDRAAFGRASASLIAACGVK